MKRHNTASKILYMPEYDNLKVYVPILSRLKEGDILLTIVKRSKSKKNLFISSVIAKFSHGEFSHALICIKPPTFIEATLEGVQNLSMANCFCHSLDNVKVLRYQDSSISRSAAAWAAEKIGQNYSISNAVLSIFPQLKLEIDDGGIFCSALVAAAYRSADLSLFSSINPMKITPNSLIDIGVFSDVTKSSFREILSPPNIESMSALDGDRFPSPLAQQSSIFNQYYEDISIIINDFQKLNGILQEIEISNFFECLKWFLNIMSEDIKKSFKKSTIDEISSLDRKALNIVKDGKWEEITTKARTIEIVEIDRIKSESYKDDPDIDMDQIIEIIRITEGQISARLESLDYAILLNSSSKLWAWWDGLQRKSISILIYRKSVLANAIKRIESR